MKTKPKAIVMLSGGLDSRLVVKILQEQKIGIMALFFKLPFGTGCCNEKCSFNFAQLAEVKLKIFDCTKGNLFKEYIKLIKKPKHGYGTSMNPCIDCRIFMLKKAKKFMKKNKFDFISTGEVLGERPMSQNKRAMNLIEEESGLKGKILRPLSAKLLPETQAEKENLVDRHKLFDIKGRKRHRQIALVKKYKISYPHPAGGCLLCEKLYCKKLKKFLNKKNLNYKDIQLLKIGRHFDDNIILGRDEKENKLLEKETGIKIIPKQPGPTALIKNKKHNKKAKELIQKYSKHKIGEFDFKK